MRVTIAIHLVWLTGLQALNLPTYHNGRVIKRKHSSIRHQKPVKKLDFGSNQNKNILINPLREKGRDLTQSYDKSPYTNRNVKKAK